MHCLPACHNALHSGRSTTNSATSSLRRTTICSAATDALSTSAPAPAFENINSPVVKVVETVFKFPPLFKFAVAQARKKIVDRGRQVGVDFDHEVQLLAGATNWEEQLYNVTDPAVQMPSYYLKPFHAYDAGNLCWEAAWEVGPAAVSVHAPVMDSSGKNLDPEGDLRLRGGFSAVMLQLLQQLPHRPVHDVLDLGCATGLSSLELQRVFPEASITGIDLSPHFLAVADFQQRQRKAGGAKQKDIQFIHRMAEDTGLGDGSMDLVSISLVCHELPQSAARDILKEAYRVLRPGGVIAMMDQDPFCPAFQRLLGNPMAFAAFKSTEPWLTDYITLDLSDALRAAGFTQPCQGQNTPRHRTILAVKA